MNTSTTRLKQIVLVAAAVLVLATFTAPLAHADAFGLPTSTFTVFGANSVTINDALDENTVCVTGGVGTNGTISLDKCKVQGNLYAPNAGAVSLGPHGAFSGSEIFGSQAAVVSTMSSVSSSLAGLAANTTLATLNSNQTFNNSSASGGTFVVNVTGDVALNGNTLTFTAANPNDKFVVNVGGNFNFAQSVINLGSNVAAGNIIFNVTDNCSSPPAEINKSASIFSGILLAPNCDIRVHNQGTITADLFGKTVLVDSAATIQPPTTTAPEPSSLVTLLGGMTGLAVLLRRKIR